MSDQTKTSLSVITIYEQHNDGSPALWTESDGVQLFVCDANARDEISETELDEYVADWRANLCNELEELAIEQVATICAQDAVAAATTSDGTIATDSDGFALIDASAAGPTVFDFEALSDAIGALSDGHRQLFEDEYQRALNAELKRLEASNA